MRHTTQQLCLRRTIQWQRHLTQDDGETKRTLSCSSTALEARRSFAKTMLEPHHQGMRTTCSYSDPLACTALRTKPRARALSSLALLPSPSLVLSPLYASSR